jgi:hypothetical protein
VDAADLTFTDGENGDKKAVFEVLALSFGDNGQIGDQLGKSYTLTVKSAGYREVLANGFVYHFLFPVKKTGAYQYRVAIRDSGSGKIGAASQFIDVPDLKKKRLTPSSIVIENFTADEWRRATLPDARTIYGDPMTDTAVRRVALGSVIRYGLEVYNAKLDSARRPRVTTRVRVFRDGQIILDGKPTPVDFSVQTDPTRIKTSGAIAIGQQMRPGDYILQVVVTDELAKRKQQIATQFIQFEVVGN